jgi:hypothetical protein
LFFCLHKHLSLKREYVSQTESHPCYCLLPLFFISRIHRLCFPHVIVSHAESPTAMGSTQSHPGCPWRICQHQNTFVRAVPNVVPKCAAGLVLQCSEPRTAVFRTSYCSVPGLVLQCSGPCTTLSSTLTTVNTA